MKMTYDLSHCPHHLQNNFVILCIWPKRREKSKGEKAPEKGEKKMERKSFSHVSHVFTVIAGSIKYQ